MARLVDDFTKTLSDKGISFSTLTQDNLRYDHASKKLMLIDYDGATLSPVGTKVSADNIARMRTQTTTLLNSFKQNTLERRNAAIMVGAQETQVRRKYDNYLTSLKVAVKTKEVFEQGAAQFKRENSLSHLASKLPYNYQMMKDTQLMEQVFIDNPLKLTPHELGEVSEFIRLARKQAEIQETAYKAMMQAYRLTPGCTRLSLQPQTLLTEAAGKGSRGRCRPLAYAMEVAIHTGRSEQMLANLGRVRAQVDQGAGRRFIEALDAFHPQNLEAFETAISVGGRETLTVNEIVDQLKQASGAASFSMRTDLHAMSIGVSVKENGMKSYHFYDPNIGLVEYSSSDALLTGLQKTAGDKGLAAHYGADAGRYKLYRLDVEALSKTPIERQPEWKIADFSQRKQPNSTKWRREEGKLHKEPVETVCHTVRGKRSICSTAKNYKISPDLSLASMARPSKNIIDWQQDVGLFINDLQSQRVKVLISLDDQLSTQKLPSGDVKADYLRDRLRQNGIDYIVETKNFIEDGYTFPADVDISVPGPYRQQVEQLADLVTLINDRRAAVKNASSNDVVAVHCGAGDGRSGTVKSAVMIEKLLCEQPQKYRQGVIDNIKGQDINDKIHTDINEDLSDILDVDNEVYDVVRDAVKTVRGAPHDNAVERMSDVNLLMGYARLLVS
ncbi:hypothetical protein QRZ34_28670 [Klebsiella michiganensis]|uniref:hypothetical protein n=1 Tax=Klebsiella michiganensis TaxID=1134687 RepID=UPI0025710555|nr:hypothetical protein [Klebsiella michiganensis]MDL4454967.1 hypothetical protein [Klebsiella michiganensis]